MERLTFRATSQVALLAELHERDLLDPVAGCGTRPIRARRDGRPYRLGRWMRGVLRSGVRPAT